MPLGQAVLTGASPMGFGQIVLFIIGMVAIIAAAYYTTYFVGKKSFKLRSGRNIVLRDRFAVSKDKSFFVLEAYGKVYIVGVTNHSMTVIDTLDEQTVTEYQDVQKQQAQTAPRPGGAAGGGMYQRMINGMAEFISTKVLKRGNPPRDGAHYDRGEDFEAIYKKTMSEDREEPEEGAEDEE